MSLRQLLIRFFTPLVWKISGERKIRALQEFALTELDSAWQSLYAMDFIPDPKLRAMLFHHALDEYKHYDVFNNLAREFRQKPSAQSLVKRLALWKPSEKNGPLNFFSYIHAGECQVNADFAAYSRSNIDENIRIAFTRIMEDEAHHEAGFRKEVFPRLSGSWRAVRRSVLWFRCKRTYGEYVKLMESVGEVPFAVAMTLLYFVGGLFASPICRQRFLLSPESQLKMVVAQREHVKGEISAALAGVRE
jgi:hypothetical protein